MSHIPTNQRHSPIGWVPKGWGLKKLSSLADISYGISDPLDKTLKQGIPIIGMPNVTKYGRFKWAVRFFINPNNVKEKNLLRTHDILFNWRNGSKDHLGKTVLYKLIGKHTHVGFLLRIRCNDALDPTYCDLYIKGIKDRGYFLKAKIQVNNTFNKEELSSLPVVLPPFLEQQKIAQILSTWDKAIEKLESLITAKQKCKKALMQKLLIGKKRFPGFNGKWKNLHLIDVSQILVSPVDKKTIKDEKPILLCNYTDVYYNLRITRDLQFMRATATEREISRFKLREGDVIITKDSETPGDIAIPAFVSEDLGEVVCGYHLAILRPKKGELDGEFLNYLLSMPKTRYYFFTLATGATRFGLSVGGIEKAHFHLPPIEEQQKIASVLSTVDNEIQIHQKQLATLKEQKKGLMQQLLTGKKRVKVDESKQPAAVGA